MDEVREMQDKTKENGASNLKRTRLFQGAGARVIRARGFSMGIIPAMIPARFASLDFTANEPWPS